MEFARQLRAGESGATYPRELAEVREIVGDMPFLVPGVGAQGGDVVQAVQNGRTRARRGTDHQLVARDPVRIIGEDFADAARKATLYVARSDQCRASLDAHQLSSPQRLRRSVFWQGCSGGGSQGAGSSSANILFFEATARTRTSLDPQRARAVESQTILRDLCEGLTTLAKDASTAPGVAKEWTASADGKAYTFTLRPEARWSNGDKVVAEDFVAGLRRLVDPTTASQYAQIIDVVANAGDIINGKQKPETSGCIGAE